jgi:ceramide glucosyltransferase
MNGLSFVVALSIALHVAVAAGFVLTVLASAVRRRGRSDEAHRRGARSPRVTILKPLAGADDELTENLASLARLDYPDFETIFGVASVHDSAHPIALRVVRAHPEIRGRVVVTDPSAATNPKVAQLAGMIGHATGEVLVVSDSNVRLDPDYLRAMVDTLQRDGVGLVTSLVAGTGERSVGAALENLQWGAFVTPLVALSDKACAVPITVGKSMAFRRSDAERLDVIGRVGEVLAEDHVMGRIFHGAGLAVRTSFHRIENRNVRASLRLTWERHSRWMKMRRAIAPWPFYFEPLLSPVVVASVVSLVAPAREAASWWALAALVQTSTAWICTRVTRGTWMPIKYLPVELLRSYVSFACWLRAWSSRRVTWRGNAFAIGKDSAIVPLRSRPRAEAFARP